VISPIIPVDRCCQGLITPLVGDARDDGASPKPSPFSVGIHPGGWRCCAHRGSADPRVPHDLNMSIAKPGSGGGGGVSGMGPWAVGRSAVSMRNDVIADGTDETCTCWGKRGLGGITASSSSSPLPNPASWIPYDTVCGGSHSKFKMCYDSRHQGGRGD
jgi:hypothetical protein